MLLKQLILTNYRNIINQTLIPDDKLTVLVGKNGQGKTNYLESIFVCCTGRSHRTSKDVQLINWDKDNARIIASSMQRDGSHKVEVHLKKNTRKTIMVNNNNINRLGELMGHLNCVLFAPEDLSLVKDGPSFRRRYIDMALAQTDRSYFYSLQQYQRALKQRNELLKQIIKKSSLKSTLSVWDYQLAQIGSKLIVKRLKFVESIKKQTKSIHHDLTTGSKMEIKYHPPVDSDNEAMISDALLKLLDEHHDIDIGRGTTTTGPHKDDLGIYLDSKDARIYGSQGQKKTCALALKLSQLKVMESTTGETPLLLLDDVFSELDSARREMILEYIGKVQTIITCVDFDTLKSIKKNGACYRVTDGNILREN